HAMLRLGFGGDMLTDYLLKHISERGYSLVPTSAREIARCIKERLCYVTLDFDKEMEKFQKSNEFEKSYQLPDGTSITIGEEQFKCPEALFSPNLIGWSAYGIHEWTSSSIMKCDID